MRSVPKEIVNKYHQKLFENGSLGSLSRKSCAIVGNSGNLEGSEFGPKIDSCDLVVRFNAAPTDGYESDVGSRTTHRFVNLLIQRGDSLGFTTGTPDNFISTVRNETIILKYAGSSYHSKAVEKIHDSCTALRVSRYYKHYYDNALEHYVGENEIPPGFNVGKSSLGFRAVLIFLPIVKSLDLFGFGFYSETEPEKYHYWEEFTRPNKGPHSYENEQKLMNQLEKLEDVTFHRSL